MKKKILIGSILLLCAFGFSGVDAFASSVLNVEQQGGNLILTGTGFGAHGDFSPTRPEMLSAAWNNLEIGSFNGGGLTLTNSYPENWAIISGGTNRVGSANYASKFYNNGRLGAYYHGVNGNNGQVYCTFWFMMPAGTQSGKFARLYGDDNRNVYFSSGGDNTQIRGYANVVNASTVWGSPDSIGSNIWRRIELWVDTSDGEVSVWMDGKLQWTRFWFPAGPNFNGHTYDIGNMIDSGSGSYNFDDIYIDYTQARVEIGNAPTWDRCTHKEIQIPTEWSSGTSITVQANYGSFNTGDTAYLFVVDADGNVNTNGYPIVIGGGGGDRDRDSFPIVNISSPTSATTYATSQDTIAISGTASDDDAISSITWSNDRGGKGPAINGSGDWASWSIENIALQEGDNVITVTATDSADQTSSDTITVISSDIVQAWNATEQTGDLVFKDSGVTYCVRLLIEGDHVTQSGSTVRLGFQGRNSGDYTIRKVSVAERDTGGAEGDVIDSTWTRVTFDENSEATWASDVMTVAAGAEKLSDPISFSLQAGKDFYITFKIDTPSVYLNPPAFYRELYFSSADHTDDIDWSANGHSITQDYHALSKIYVISGETPSVPSEPTGLTVIGE